MEKENMKIGLEIGDNLKSAIFKIIDSVNSINRQMESPEISSGAEVKCAFGINFVELMEKNSEVENLIINVEKRGR